jgi:hypothetical protein
VETKDLTVLCPRCEQNRFTPYGVDWEPSMPALPALSRADNKTYICSECGQDEALHDFFVRTPLTQPGEWPIKETT